VKRRLASQTWRKVAILVALMTCGNRAHAAATEHWIAVSNTAISITGDVRFSPSRIVFVNHAALPLAPVGEATGLTWADSMHDRPVTVYRITQRGNPQLLGGNFLCGAATTPSFLSVLKQGDDVYLTIFTGAEPPTARDFASRICAGFAYSLN
jgi:hypothetical protein